MNQIIEYLNSPAFRAALLVIVPIVIFGLGKIAPLLDVTKWPGVLQPILPLLLAGMPVLVGELEAGATMGGAAFAALLQGLEAIGTWHVGKRYVGGAVKGAGRVMLAGCVLLILPLAGCAGSLESNRMALEMVPRADGEARDSKRCQELDAEYRLWSGWEAFGASLAAGTGVGQIPIEGLPDEYQRGARIGLGVTTVAAATFVAYAEDRSNTAAETWALECSQ